MDLQSPQAGTREGTRRNCDHDRQAAEDKKDQSLALFFWLIISQAFLFGSLLQPSAMPSCKNYNLI
jgi:hypothetical protein